MAKGVAITGRRPMSLPWQYDETDERAVALKNRLKYRLAGLIDRGYTTFYIGMAEGIDTYVADILFDMRALPEYASIKVVACIPYRGFADQWSTRSREHFYTLLGMADEVVTLSDVYPDRSKFSRNQYMVTRAIFMRNKYMVDSSDLLLAVYDNVENGGTYNTLMYARSIDRPIEIEEI